MDLTKAYPRSPKVEMSGLAHVPRMLDKARASASQTLGEYIFPCPLDKIILDFLQVDAGEFARIALSETESGIAAWIKTRCSGRTPAEIASVNGQILRRQPSTPERLRDFLEMRAKIDPSREDVQTWVDLIDLEEGRL